MTRQSSREFIIAQTQQQQHTLAGSSVCVWVCTVFQKKKEKKKKITIVSRSPPSHRSHSGGDGGVGKEAEGGRRVPLLLLLQYIELMSQREWRKAGGIRKQKKMKMKPSGSTLFKSFFFPLLSLLPLIKVYY